MCFPKFLQFRIPQFLMNSISNKWSQSFGIYRGNMLNLNFNVISTSRRHFLHFDVNYRFWKHRRTWKNALFSHNSNFYSNLANLIMQFSLLSCLKLVKTVKITRAWPTYSIGTEVIISLLEIWEIMTLLVPHLKFVIKDQLIFEY